jgi:hypothetical protein
MYKRRIDSSSENSATEDLDELSEDSDDNVPTASHRYNALISGTFV